MAIHHFLIYFSFQQKLEIPNASSGNSLSFISTFVANSSFTLNYCFSDPLSLVRDHRAKEVLTAQGIAVRSFNADLLYEPWDVNDAQGRPFTTFATFWDRCLSMPFDPEAPLLPPKRIISGMSSFKLFLLMVPHFYVCDLRECLASIGNINKTRKCKHSCYILFNHTVLKRNSMYVLSNCQSALKLDF